jgi:hypothetical protein
MMADIHTSSPGNVRDKFLPYDYQTNKNHVMKAYWESGFNLDASTLLKIAEWPENVECSE